MKEPQQLFLKLINVLYLHLRFNRAVWIHTYNRLHNASPELEFFLVAPLPLPLPFCLIPNKLTIPAGYASPLLLSIVRNWLLRKHPAPFVYKVLHHLGGLWHLSSRTSHHAPIFSLISWYLRTYGSKNCWTPCKMWIAAATGGSALHRLVVMQCNFTQQFYCFLTLLRHCQ